MTFAAPLFLMAALAAAIPVILHMINRQQARNLPFPSLRFLKISAEKTRRRRRVHDLLLLMLRAAVLLLIAFGLAKPTVTNLSALWGGANTAVAIVLDNSASMGAIDADRMRFDLASAAVGQILDELHDGDQMVLLTTGGPEFPGLEKLDRTKQSIREILPQCKVSCQRADLGAKIARAREILSQAKTPNKQIFVLTDMQKVCWDSDTAHSTAEGQGGSVEFSRSDGKRSDASDAGTSSTGVPTAERGNQDVKRELGNEDTASIPVIFVDCGSKPKPNITVRSVAVDSAVPVIGVPIAVRAEFLNTSPVAWPCVADLYIDGAKEAGSPTLDLPPGGRVKHDFTFTCKTPGLHRGEVRLAGGDGSKADDSRYFTLEVDSAIPVAIVKGQRREIACLDDSYYLEKALAANTPGTGAIRAAVLSAADLATEPLSAFKAIFLVNVPAPNPDAAERLRSYVENGGNLIWVAGDSVDCDAYNSMNQQAKEALLPVPLLEVRTPRPGDNRDSWSINFLDKVFPAFRQLTEPASLYQSVLVHKHVKLAAGNVGQISNLSPDNAGQTANLSYVLARLDDGEPLFVMQKSDAGSVFFLGTGVHVNWTNLPLRPIFLPLVTRLVFELAGVEQAHRSILAGRPIVLPFPKAAEPLGIEVVPPSGEIIRLKTQAAAGKTGQEFRYPETYDAGVYVLRVLDAAKSTQLVYAVNVDPAESDPAKVDRLDLEKRYAPAPLLFAENPRDLSDTFKTLREGKSLWGVFLGVVLFGLVFETFLSNWLGPRKEDFRERNALV